MADGKVVIDVILNDGSVAKGIANIDGIGKSGERAGLGIGKMVTALGLVKVASMALNTVKSSMDSAISRFDTMQKFPKVMSALGFNTEQSNNSIKKLSDGIDGLPTKLDDVVASTQQMTAITGDLDRSTNAVIGLNNAFLASGASQDAAARGQQQYNKIISTGKVELDSWQTLQETMPLALQKTAEAMGFTGKSAQNDLYKALQSGHITIDQFTDKIIELGTGTGMLADLAKKNSLGIATSFGNLKNSVAKNLANMLTKIDEITQKLTGKTIAQNIDSLKVIINNSFKFIIENMDKIIPVIETIKTAISGLVGSFLEFLKNTTGIKSLADLIYLVQLAFSGLYMVITGGIGSSKELKEYFLDAFSPEVTNVIFAFGKVITTAFDIAKKAIQTLSTVVGGAITWIIKNFDLVKAAVVGAVAAFVTFQTITKTIAIVKAAIAAFNATMTVFKVVMAVGKNVELLSFALGNMANASKLAAAGQKVLNVVMSINPFVAIVTAVIALVAVIVYLWKTNEGFRKAVIGIWNGIVDAFVGAKDSIVGAWNGMVSWFSSVWDGIKNAFSNAIRSINSFMSSAWDGIKSAASIAWSAITKVIMTVLQPFINAFLNIWDSVSHGLSMIWDGIKLIAQGAWELIKNIILTPVLMIVDLITGDFSGMAEHLSQIWENIKSAVFMVWDGISLFLGGIVTTIVDFAINMFNNFMNGLSSIWESIKTGAAAAWQWIQDTVANLINGTVSIAQSLWDGLKNFVSNTFESIKTTASNIWEGIKTTISNAIEGAKNAVDIAINKIKGFFKAIGDIDLFEIGKNVVQGLIDGVGSMVNAVKDKIGEVANGIKDKITGALGIHSPSRWMRDMIGKNMMIGWEIGIDKNAKLPKSAMQSAVDDIVLPSFTAESILSSRVGGIGNSDNITNNYFQNQNNAIVEAINKLSNRPIVTNIDVDSTNIARTTSKAMTQQQYYDERTSNRLRGVLI